MARILFEMFGLREAGVANAPSPVAGKKKRKGFKHANGGAMSDPDEEPDEDELGPDMDYADPSPEEEPEAPARGPEPVRAAKPFKEPEKPVPFTAQSAKPSPALQGGKGGAAVKADKATLDALRRALLAVRTGDDDLQDWVDDAVREIGRAERSGGDLTLPKFEATPDLDDFDDAGGSDEDED